MTTAQKQNIGRGVRAALELKRKMELRKRQSEAMKASWVRRRAENGALVASFTGEPRPMPRRESLWEVAKVLGIDSDQLIREEIRKVLEL